MRHVSLSVGALRVDSITKNGVDQLARITTLESGAVASGLTATITLGTAAAGSQAATIQVKDSSGTNIDYVANIDVYLSGATTGIGLVTNAADTLTATTGTIVAAFTAGKFARVQTDATGKAVLAVASSTSARTFYAVVVLPNGKQVVSAAIIPTPA